MSKIKFISVLLGLFCMSLFSVRSQQFLPTNYDEPFRGQFHFSQQSGWMNDVNGIWYQDGVYHLTYQSYPYYLDGNPKYWGHATSPDMIHWTQLPTVLNPFGEPDGNVPGACWSGSTVIDFNNTSGFGTAENPPLVTIYTATSRGTCLAYSLDKGATWTPYSDNPVNVAGPNEETRDPHVLWHQPTQKWVCVIFENGFTFYTSPDLKNWTKTDNINWGYECPDFFELPVDGGAAAKWVLLQADGQYFTGDFDGADFTPDAGGPYITTHNYGFGGGFYASQTFFQHNFPGNRTVQMAWMLGMGTGSTAPWTHNASFPCELALKTFPEGIRLTRNPVSEITTLYKNTQTWTNQVLCSNKNLFTNKLAKCFDMEVVLDVSDATADLVMFQIANKIINYDITNETLYGKSLKPVNNQVKIRFLVDWGELEIFGNDGQYSYVENFRFTPGDHSISMIANGDINLVSARFSELDRIWDNTANNAYADDSDPAAVYSGAWATGTNESGYYNYDCHIATAAGSSVEYTFKGKQISWYGLKNNDLGKASVYIDGVLAKADIDCYSTTRVVQQLFTKTDLPDESHTIKVVATGTKNPASSGIALVHDYFGFLRAPQAEAPATDLQHFIMYGQSLSTGHEAYPVSISTIPGNYMIGEQIWINYGNINLEQLNPLRATVARGLQDLSESPLHGAVNHIRLKLKDETDLTNVRFIATSAGVSGQSIESLSKEAQVNNLYGNYSQALQSAQGIAENTNSPIKCPVIFWLQGEWNYTGDGYGLIFGSKPTSDKEEYKNLLTILKNNMQADACARYQQDENPLFITYQVGAQYTRGKTLNIGMAQLELSNESPDVVCAGPVYPMTDVGGHLDGNGYRWYGEMLGKVYYLTKIKGEDFSPLQPKRLYRDAENVRKVLITYRVPKPPLVLDEHTLKAEKSAGFFLYQNGNRQNMTSVEVINDSTIAITATSDLNGQIGVQYAGESSSGHGNIRDSDDYPAFFNYESGHPTPASGHPKDEAGNVIFGQPYPLYNFSVAFYYEIQADKTEYVVPHLDGSYTAIKNGKKEAVSIRQAGKSLFVTIPEAGNLNLELFDISGKSIGKYNDTLTASAERKYALDFVSPGIYIVKTLANNQVNTFKIIL